MKRPFVFFFVLTLISGCAHEGPLVQPEGTNPQKPQYHNRMRLSENTDLFGV